MHSFSPGSANSTNSTSPGGSPVQFAIWNATLTPSWEGVLLINTSLGNTNLGNTSSHHGNTTRYHGNTSRYLGNVCRYDGSPDMTTAHCICQHLAFHGASTVENKRIDRGRFSNILPTSVTSVTCNQGGRVLVTKGTTCKSSYFYTWVGCTCKEGWFVTEGGCRRCPPMTSSPSDRTKCICRPGKNVQKQIVESCTSLQQQG